MIKTLKSDLRLRPTYDELIGMIEEQGDPNRPPIDQVIDRRATVFRNNQFGSQFDNVDFLGLKKQEEDKVKKDLRQAELRETAMATGSSTGVLSYDGRTPVGAYNAAGFETPDSDDYRMTLDQINRIRAELDAGLQRQQEAQQASSSTVRSDLVEAHSQSLPIGVRNTTEVAEEGEEEEETDDDETQVPPQSRKHKETIDYNVHSIATDEEEEMPPLETPAEVAEEGEEEEEETDDDVRKSQRMH